MPLRETLAMAICQCPKYSFPPLNLEHWDRTQKDEPFVERHQQCVCARDGRTPVISILTCCNNLAKADAVIARLRQAGVTLPETIA